MPRPGVVAAQPVPVEAQVTAAPPTAFGVKVIAILAPAEVVPVDVTVITPSSTVTAST